MTRSSTWAAAPLAAAACAVLLSACGGSSNTGSTTSAAASSGGATTASSAAGTNVAVTEKEFAITLPSKTFTAGTYTFMIQNAGTFPHNLTIKGPGVDSKASPTLSAGQSGSLTVTLAEGSYELWCAVDSHKDRGMDVTITVG